MANEIYYESGASGAKLDLHNSDLAFVLMGSEIHSRMWARTLTAYGARGISRSAREVKMSYVATDDQANKLRNAFDADIHNETPGTLVYQGWSARCYVFESSTDAQYAGWVKRDATLALIDHYWWREKSRHFVVGLDASGLDHDYDHAYDLSFSVGKGSIEVATVLGAKPRITFYGPCTNPYVTIGDNRYEVDVQVLSGHTCTIDATSTNPSVTLTDDQGNSQSVFSSAVRTGGKGGGSYAFEQLPYGTLQVSWSGSFAFDIAWRELETEPPWNR